MLAALASSAFATEDDASDADGPAIPPGQEALLLEMLGKGTALPDRCKLADGQVEYTIVKATYTCPWGEAVLELSHASQAASPVAQTKHFAVRVEGGSPPESLADAVAALVAAREADFEWAWPASEGLDAVDGDAGGEE